MSHSGDARRAGSNGKSDSMSNKVTGVVKFYSVQKCYGFIKRDDTKEYVFVHSKSVTGRNQRRVTRSLAKGEHVEFSVVMSDRSPEAIDVTGLDGAPVIGSEYALVTMQWLHYNDYKHQLMTSPEAGRALSPRARRFFHRKTSRKAHHFDQSRRYEPAHSQPNPETSKGTSDKSNRDPTNDDDASKPQARRRNRRYNRKPKKYSRRSPEKSDPNIISLLSDMTLGNKMNSANSTSSESLDFEKINCDEAGSIPSVVAGATSRLAAAFNKGN